MHEVEGLIARAKELAGAVRQLDGAVICPLVQGFALLPMTDALAKQLAASPSGTQAPLPKPIGELSDGLHVLAIWISRRTPVAYISTSYFGGIGTQDALAWDRGSLRFSPAVPGYRQPWPNTPISQALRAIGVVAGDGQDEFDTVGLVQHRSTQQWASARGKPVT